MIFMQLRKFPPNVVRYAVVLVIGTYFIHRLQYPWSAAFVSRIPPPPIRFNLESFVVGAALSFSIVIGGILVDKYGRRLGWAVSRFLYGASILIWFLVFIGRGTSSGSLFPILLDMMWALSFLAAALQMSWVAWLFDGEGKDGMKDAYGLLYIGSLPLILAGLGLGIFLEGFSGSPRVSILLAGLILIGLGFWIFTFPENYGDREKSLLGIAKSGITQFKSSRVLQLIVIQGIFIDLPLWVKGTWKNYLVEEFNLSSDETFKTLWLITVAIAFLAGVFLVLVKGVDYNKLIVYPTLCMAGLYLLMPLAPSPQVFTLLIGGVSAVSLLRITGILILMNDAISKNRATVLSLVMFLMTVTGIVSTFWYMSDIQWDVTFLAAGACALISLVPVGVALKIHGRSAPVSPQA